MGCETREKDDAAISARFLSFARDGNRSVGRRLDFHDPARPGAYVLVAMQKDVEGFLLPTSTE